MEKMDAARIISEHTGLKPTTIMKSLEQTYPKFMVCGNKVFQYRFKTEHREVTLDVSGNDYRLQHIRIFCRKGEKSLSESFFKHELQGRYGINTKGEKLVCRDFNGMKVYEILSGGVYAEIKYKEGISYTTRICRVHEGVV